MESDEEEAFLLLLLLNEKVKKRKSKNKFWVHPFLEGRTVKSLFCTLYDDLQQDEDDIKFPQITQLYQDSDYYPYVIVGDEGFGLEETLNGILAKKRRIFHRPSDVSVELDEDI